MIYLFFIYLPVKTGRALINLKSMTMAIEKFFFYYHPQFQNSGQTLAPLAANTISEALDAAKMEILGSRRMGDLIKLENPPLLIAPYKNFDKTGFTVCPSFYAQVQAFGICKGYSLSPRYVLVNKSSVLFISSQIYQ